MNHCYHDLAFYRPPGKRIGFIRNDKCGSTYFANIFEANGWMIESAENIDWQIDHVFSFIMDPYVRHVKGMVEDAIAVGSEKIMIQNFGKMFWENIPWLGTHSMPISVKFGKLADNIDWIPIDIGIPSTEDIVDQLLKTHDEEIDWSIPVDRNESSPYEKEMFKIFAEMLNSANKAELLNHRCQDYKIYKKTIDKYKIFTSLVC